MKIALSIVAPLVLAGCGPGGFLAGAAVGAARQQAPVSATEGGTATLYLTACPVRQEGGEALSGLIQSLMSQGTIVRADDGATSRLVINACPHEAALPAAVELARTAAQRRGTPRP